MRCFAALPIGSPVTHRLIALQKGVRGARWRPPENFHITLGFFGDLDDEQVQMLDDMLDKIRIGPFEFCLKGAGFFGGSDPHALWLGVEPHRALIELAQAVRSAARKSGIAMEARKYMPHLTLAYLGRNTDLQRVIAFEKRLARFETDPLIADRFHLYSSSEAKTGPNIYQREASYPLIPRSRR